MKIECDECHGTGKVQCGCCIGIGIVSVGIDQFNPMSFEWRQHPKFEQLLELKRDAIRVKEQADKLKKINPKCSGSYADQLISTLATINQMADKLLP